MEDGQYQPYDPEPTPPLDALVFATLFHYLPGTVQPRFSSTSPMLKNAAIATMDFALSVKKKKITIHIG